jgi:hypothetical protein
MKKKESGDEYMAAGGKRKKEKTAITIGLPRVISVHRWVMGRGAMVVVHSLEAASPGTRSPGRRG